MKKALCILSVMLILLSVMPAFAQEESFLKDGAVYRFVNVQTKETLAASYYGVSSIASVAQTEGWNQDLNQAWRTHLQENGSWKLECLSSGWYLAVFRNSKKVGATISINAESTSSGQSWIISGESGSARLISSSSGLCLQPENDALGKKVTQETIDDDSLFQCWKVIQVDDGSTTFPRMLMLKDASIHTGCPEIIKESGKYYLLAWDNTPSCSIRSSDNLTDWSSPTRVYSYAEGLPFSWMREDIPEGGMWCPGIYRIGETFYIYYAISTQYGQRSTIGCYTNTTLDPEDPAYQWVDGGPVIRSYINDPYNCIDPCIVTDEDGLPWLVFGSAWTGIKIVRLNPENGHLLNEDNPEIIALASRVKGDRAIEAPYIIKHDDYWYLFAAVDIMTEGRYHNACGRSKSLLGPYYARDGVAMLDGGVKGGSTAVSEEKENIIMPGHASIFQDDDGQDYFVTEYWENGGALKLCISTIVWDDEGWPWTVLSPSPLSLANGDIN